MARPQFQRDTGLSTVTAESFEIVKTAKSDSLYAIAVEEVQIQPPQGYIAQLEQVTLYAPAVATAGGMHLFQVYIGNLTNPDYIELLYAEQNSDALLDLKSWTWTVTPLRTYRPTDPQTICLSVSDRPFDYDNPLILRYQFATAATYQNGTRYYTVGYTLKKVAI